MSVRISTNHNNRGYEKEDKKFKADKQNHHLYVRRSINNNLLKTRISALTKLRWMD